MPTRITHTKFLVRCYAIKLPLSAISNIHINGSVQDCSNSIAFALQLLQFCTKPSTYSTQIYTYLQEAKFAITFWTLQYEMMDNSTEYHKMAVDTHVALICNIQKKTHYIFQKTKQDKQNDQIHAKFHIMGQITFTLIPNLWITSTRVQ